jgi:hypothetical protein
MSRKIKIRQVTDHIHDMLGDYIERSLGLGGRENNM